ncbi:hypothetical protein CQW23_04057 [Capsicum baccatum]|uniref:Uncharacterized protein n=1 Tax=Capsicum baccatum TaxID=33114 RepID=A0A2G2XDZ8_CAPBA|nr:hypothetical protein CQW23_04057 [Capsicum baccatum]
MSNLHNLIDQPVIVVMQLRRAHKFQDLSQANDFKFRLESVSEATSETLSQANSQHSLSISEELTAGTVQLKTVKELLDTAQDSSNDTDKMSPIKIYTAKRGRPKNGRSISEVTDDVDQLSGNKPKKVIKKERISKVVAL